MKPLKPWLLNLFKQLLHAERHYRMAEDFARRVSLIAFDNAIETSIFEYLSQKPYQRGDRAYAKQDVNGWMRNYHTKIQFLETELEARKLEWEVDKDNILWAHDRRGEYYHSPKGIPEKEVLEIARQGALWVFAVLHDVPDIEARLDDALGGESAEQSGDTPEDDSPPDVTPDPAPRSDPNSHSHGASPVKFVDSDSGVREDGVESAAIFYFQSLGYAVAAGPEIAPGAEGAERDSFQDVLLAERVRAALARLNPELPGAAYEEAFRKLSNISSPVLADANHEFHFYLANGLPIEYVQPDGEFAFTQIRLFDFEKPDRNDWLVVSQFSVVGEKTHRFDLVVFVNGFPVGAFEFKSPADESATLHAAYQQLQTYKRNVPEFFIYNELLAISDGISARIGTLTSPYDRFAQWRTIEGEELADPRLLQLEVLIRGVFDRNRLLELLRDFIVFETDEEAHKKFAGYHQYHAVRHAVEQTVRASRPEGDQRIGVVWHTQGSGKSLTMTFYAGKVIRHPAMENPTIVVMTDRNDLDDQLFGVFSRCQKLLRQEPVQAKDREHLRELLQTASGGVIFTTVQKFQPTSGQAKNAALSKRRNIVVIADEAHRSQYDFIDGYAKAIRDTLPNAAFIGFTGTPIEQSDRSTRAVFGDNISVYDISRAVADGTTRPIYYESRLAKLELPENEKPKLDEEFDELTEAEELEGRYKIATKWSKLEALVGTEKRLHLIARDLVEHFESRQEVLEGKAMIVCMSRRICVALYRAIVKLRPEWHGQNDDEGKIKVIMTGNASDPESHQPHIRSKGSREQLATRFKRPDDPFQIVIVRDMWLTGFDAPCLHTMYLDKPMKGHNIMQAIARVNRVFEGKDGGLVVDYLGLANHLKQALVTYGESGGSGQLYADQSDAVAIMREKYEICDDFFAGFDRSAWEDGSPQVRLALLGQALEYMLSGPQSDAEIEPTKKDEHTRRYLQAVAELKSAFALAVPNPDALEIAVDVGFFLTVRSALVKTTAVSRPSAVEMDRAVEQMISRALSSDQVIDIFALAGIDRPDMSILSEEFLAEVAGMQHRNLAVEALRKLLSDEVRDLSRTNYVQSEKFSKILTDAVRRYQNRAIEAAQVIEELIHLARDMRSAGKRGEELNLNPAEIAFYDALEVNDSAVKVLGEETLRTIARELVEYVRNNVTIDWNVRESVRARLRVKIKAILKKYGYPPDKAVTATETVLKQAERAFGAELS